MTQESNPLPGYSNPPTYGGMTVKGFLSIVHSGATLLERHYAVTWDNRYFRSEGTFRIGYPNFGNGEWVEVTKSEFFSDDREYIGEYVGVGISHNDGRCGVPNCSRCYP